MANWLDKAKEAAQMAADAAKKAAESAKNAAQNANFSEMYDKTKAMAMHAADEAKKAADSVMAAKPPKEDPSVAPSDPEADAVDMGTSEIYSDISANGRDDLASVVSEQVQQVNPVVLEHTQEMNSASQERAQQVPGNSDWIEQCNIKIQHIELLLHEIKTLLAKNT